VFFDVSGDYQLTALDALIVINELSRRPQASAESETLTVSSASAVILIDDDDDESEFARDLVFDQLGLSETL
jgi:hypothetical protein